jgi:hypothetical protein
LFIISRCAPFDNVAGPLFATASGFPTQCFSYF